MSTIREYNGIEYPNRQLRVWVCILYPESNESHKIAVEMIKEMPQSLLMCHNRSYTNDGEKKELHYHCIIKFNSPYWLYSLIDYLHLENDSLHLFHSIKDREVNFKKLDDYIYYLTHAGLDKEYYEPNQFIGSMRDYAINLCKEHDITDKDRFRNLLNDLEIISNEPNFKFYSYITIYDTLVKMGHEQILYKKWFYVRQFIDDLKNVY